MFKKMTVLSLVALLLTGCSSVPANPNDSTPSLLTQKTEAYDKFESRLNDSFDSALYDGKSKLVTVTNDSNFEETSTQESKLYFKNGSNKFVASFNLSSSGTEANKVKDYYSSCPSVLEMLTSTDFKTGTVNKYEGSHYYIDKNEMWQIVTNKDSGIMVQYFQLDDNGLLIRQEVGLQTPASGDEEQVQALINKVMSWRLGDVKHYLATTSDKTVITYSYDDYSKLNLPLTADKWLEIALKQAQKPSSPVFIGATGTFIDKVTASSDGLKCALKP